MPLSSPHFSSIFLPAPQTFPSGQLHRVLPQLSPTPMGDHGQDAPICPQPHAHGPAWQTRFYPLPANAVELADNG